MAAERITHQSHGNNLVLRDGAWRWADADYNELGRHVRDIKTGERFELLGTNIAIPPIFGVDLWDKNNNIRCKLSTDLVTDRQMFDLDGTTMIAVAFLIIAVPIVIGVLCN